MGPGWHHWVGSYSSTPSPPPSECECTLTDPHLPLPPEATASSPGPDFHPASIPRSLAVEQMRVQGWGVEAGSPDLE